MWMILALFVRVVTISYIIYFVSVLLLYLFGDLCLMIDLHLILIRLTCKPFSNLLRIWKLLLEPLFSFGLIEIPSSMIVSKFILVPFGTGFSFQRVCTPPTAV